MTAKGFFDRYKRFQKYKDNQIIDNLFAFLTTPEIIDRMIIINDFSGLSPLDAVVKSVEDFELNFSSELESRQMVGAMIKYILEHFGYYPTERTTIRNSERGYFKLASRYAKKNLDQELYIEKTVQIIRR